MQDFLLFVARTGTQLVRKYYVAHETTKNMAEGVTAMMRIANLSHAQLCRVMKKHKLQTPVSYVKEIRLYCPRAYPEYRHELRRHCSQGWLFESEPLLLRIQSAIWHHTRSTSKELRKVPFVDSHVEVD